MPLSNEAIYMQLGQLIADMPDFRNRQWNTPLAQRWLGRATALLEEAVGGTDAIAFKLVAQGLSSDPNQIGHERHIQQITAILHHALAVAELRAPAAAQNGFIPVGEPFTALSAVSGVLSNATNSALLVDPYADAGLLTNYLSQAPEGVACRILSDSHSVKAGLTPAAQAWITQYGGQRPLEVRLAPARSLHDRLIIIDGRDVWSLGQSFNALGTRSPTALVRVNEETALLKVEAYAQLWATSQPLN
ncbi:hypothetical protein ACSEON_17290 [Pseudomonas aeruginosa]|nr:hypothetical protein [Pseudomonas aeruginosa]HEH8419015.1 hypothetical protein [Pseudomonas aeruginosa]